MVNKSDLLPKDFGVNRIKAWLKAEAELHGLVSIQCMQCRDCASDSDCAVLPIYCESMRSSIFIHSVYVSCYVYCSQKYYSIELVSGMTGEGLHSLMSKAKYLAKPDPDIDRPRRDIYLVGSTNVGKR